MEITAADQLDLRLVPAALTGWVVTATGIVWGTGIFAATLSAGVALAAIAARSRIGGATIVIAAAALGSGCGVAVALRVDAVTDHPITRMYSTSADVVVKPTESPRSLGSGRLMFRAALNSVELQPVSGNVVVFAPVLGYYELTAGRPASFRARIAAPTRRDLTVAVLTATGDPTLGEASALQRAAHGVRSRFAEHARQILPADQAAMLPALVLGDTATLTVDTTADFRAAGLTHLTAVSGANVTVVCGAVLIAARLLGPRPAVGLAAVALAGFIVVVQPSPSVLRAGVMGGLTLLAVATHRRRQALPALAATVIALMVVAPALAVDVGFALSVSATAGLILIAPVWSARLVDRGWPRWLAAAVTVAVAAQIVTAPLIAGISGTLSSVAIVANLAVGAVIAPITVLGTAAAALGVLWPVGAQFLIRFCGPLLWWLLRVAETAGGLPGAALPVPSGLLGVVLLSTSCFGAVLSWRWRWFRVAAGMLLLVAVAWVVASGVGPGSTIVTAT
ncbi:MAG: ComEC/Rec2 family competence protein [Mycobacterium sp.]